MRDLPTCSWPDNANTFSTGFRMPDTATAARFPDRLVPVCLGLSCDNPEAVDVCAMGSTKQHPRFEADVTTREALDKILQGEQLRYVAGGCASPLNSTSVPNSR